MPHSPCPTSAYAHSPSNRPPRTPPHYLTVLILGGGDATNRHLVRPFTEHHAHRTTITPLCRHSLFEERCDSVQLWCYCCRVADHQYLIAPRPLGAAHKHQMCAGVSDMGKVANDVELEQIVHEESVGEVRPQHQPLQATDNALLTNPPFSRRGLFLRSSR